MTSGLGSGPRALLRSWLGLLAVALLGGCAEWLEVDDDEETAAGRAARQTLRGERPSYPSRWAEPGGDGPLVPATPGLRVPLAGYWTRVRLDSMDVLLPYSHVALHRVGGEVFLRFEAVHETLRQTRSLRLVTALKLPESTVLGDLVGVDLRGPALGETTGAFQSSASDVWTLTLSRLSLDNVGDELVVGSFEGVAHRGLRGRRERRVEVGFVALRAPVPESPPD